MDKTDSEWFAVGRVHSTDPAKRQIRIEGDRSVLSAVFTEDFLYIRLITGEVRRVRVKERRLSGKSLIVELAPGVVRDSIPTMKGSTVLVNPDGWDLETFAKLPLSLLVGFRVRLDTGEPIGQIIGGYRAQEQDTAEILTDKGTSVFAPLRNEIFTRVDWKNRILTLRGLEYCMNGYED